MKKEEWDKDNRVYRTTGEDETVNQASALWARPKSEITEEQYHEFYKHVAHDFETPLAYTHAKVEGTKEYMQLLYIPAQRAVRSVGPRAPARHQALRAARVHHGRRRAPDAGVPALRARRDRFQRSAAQCLARDPAGIEGRRDDTRRLGAARAVAARGSRGKPEGQVRDVLEGVRPRASRKAPARITRTASASRSCCVLPRRMPTPRRRRSRSPITSRA